jgi:hypothetical protein
MLPFVGNALLDVCDVGGGDGNRIIRILKYLRARFDVHFRLDFIEQAKPYVDALDFSPIRDCCESTVFHNLFEEVVLPRRYDLVFLIHSIFAFENGKALDKVLSLSKSEGGIVVVSNCPDSFLAGLKRLVDQGYDDQRYEIDALMRDLKAREIDYTYLTFRTKWAIDRDTYEDDLTTILEWISLGSYQSFGADQKRAIYDYIASNSVPSNSGTLFTEEEAVIVIPAMR